MPLLLSSNCQNGFLLLSKLRYPKWKFRLDQQHHDNRAADSVRVEVRLLNWRISIEPLTGRPYSREVAIIMRLAIISGYNKM